MSSTLEEHPPQTAEVARRLTTPSKPKKYREPAYRRKGSSDFLKPTLGGLIFRYVLLALVTVIVVGPLIFQLSTSFKGPLDDIYTFPPTLIPTDFTVQNYIRVTDFIPVYLYAWHSLMVAVGTVVTTPPSPPSAGTPWAAWSSAARRSSGASCCPPCCSPAR